jgi:hypothetical protein
MAERLILTKYIDHSESHTLTHYKSVGGYESLKKQCQCLLRKS